MMHFLPINLGVLGEFPSFLHLYCFILTHTELDSESPPVFIKKRVCGAQHCPWGGTHDGYLDHTGGGPSTHEQPKPQSCTVSLSLFGQELKEESFTGL